MIKNKLISQNNVEIKSILSDWFSSNVLSDDGFFIKRIERQNCKITIFIAERFQAQFMEQHGTRAVFASDEFFLLAGRPIPDAAYCEEYPQYENGVGMLRSLADEFHDALECAEPEKLPRDSDVFLDDCTLSQVGEAIHTPIRITANDGFELLDAVLGIVL